jgi:hypothetical protein
VVESIIVEGARIGNELEYRLNVMMVRFARKYEMTSILDAIKLYLFTLMTKFPPTGGRFALVAAELKEWDMCGRLVMTLDPSTMTTGDDIGDKEMRQTLDWRGWTPEIIRELSDISEMFLWAVCQVGTKHAKASGYGQIPYGAMGPDLAKVMNE